MIRIRHDEIEIDVFAPTKHLFQSEIISSFMLSVASSRNVILITISEVYHVLISTILTVTDCPKLASLPRKRTRNGNLLFVVSQSSI